MNNLVLRFITSCVSQRNIYWTYHVNMRLKGRFISRAAVLESVDSYEIIESYPHDKYLPSFLVYAVHHGEVFHIQIAVDEENDMVRIVTIYRPTLDEWTEGFKTRRKK